MLRPLLRYLLLRLVPITIVVNALLNGLVGLLQAHAWGSVPLRGARSVGADTAGTAFAVWFLTVLLVIPVARVEAKSGRVPGFGLKALGWPALHPGLTAFGFSTFASLGTSTVAVTLLAGAGMDSVSGNGFVALKAALAALSGGLAALVAGLIAILPEPRAADDPRWCRTPEAQGGRLNYPFDYIDTGGLAITKPEIGCSGTPTWQLVIRGTLSPEHVRSAFTDLATRYPIMTMRVQALDGIPPWTTRYRYAQDPRFAIDGVFRVLDLRKDPSRLAEVAREERSRPLDLFDAFPITLTMTITADDACHLFFRQHHAIADGRAFMALLADFRDYLEAARAGRRPAPEILAPVPRRSEIEPLGLAPARRALETMAGYGVLVRVHSRALLQPLFPLVQNEGADYSGENCTVHWIVPEQTLNDWHAARKRIGASLNSLLTGALFIAAQRWHREMGRKVGRTSSLVLMETRPRDRSFVSFSNHLAFPEVELRLDRVVDPVAAIRRVQAQMDRERRSHAAIRRLLAERHLIRLIPLVDLHRIALDSKRPTQSMSFSNLIPLSFPPIEGSGWVVDQVLITTPVQPRTGISLTVIRYNGRLTFNWNYKSTVVTREMTQAFARHFEGVLEETTGISAGATWR
jgi:NRPS condensation-like uncharacterized protein